MDTPLTQNEMPGQGQPTEDSDVLDRVRACEKRADEECGDWYDAAKTDYDFADGKQWTDEEKEALEDEDRIPVTFNRIAAIVNSICGQEVANRQEVNYLPRRATLTDPNGNPIPQPASPMNDAVKWVRDNCNAEDEDSRAFRDQIVCGMGWTFLRMDYETEPDGRPEVVRVSPLLVRWDPIARRKNLADAAWVQCDWWMRREAIQAKWPDVDIGAAFSVENRDHQSPIDTSQSWKYESTQTGSDRRGDELRVTHHVERTTVTKLRAVDPATQQLREYGQDEWDTIQQNYNASPAQQMLGPLPQPVKVQRRMYWEAWVVGGIVLQTGPSPCEKDFPYQCMTAYPEEDTGYWFGVVRMLRDPQRYANRLMSLMMSILGTGAKGGVMFETGAFANQKKALSDWARWNSAIELTPGAIANQKVQPKPPVQLPQGAADLMQFCIGSIRDVSGANIEVLGQENNNQTGIVEDMKTKAGLLVLASLFDAMRYYRKRQGVILAEYVRKFISDGRLIRVLGPEGYHFVPLIRDPDGVEYDMVVDESPSSRDVKEKTWMALQVVLPMLMQAGVPPPPDVIDYAPIPQSLAIKIKQSVMQKMQQPPSPPPEVQIAQMKIQAQQAADQAKAQSDAAAQQARVMADTVIEQNKAHMQAVVDHMRNVSDAQQAKLEAALQAHTGILEAIINQIGKVAAAEVTAGMQPPKDFTDAASYPEQ